MTRIGEWRSARTRRDRAWDELATAQVRAGLRSRLPLWSRLALIAVAVLAVAGAGIAVWRAVDRIGGYSDADYVRAAEQRTSLLLTADASDPDRAEKILAGATGDFYDSFAQSADSYTRYVGEQGSRGTTTIDGAALADRRDGSAVVLVVAGTSVRQKAGAPLDQELRLRVTVTPEDGELKLSNVEFVS
ncbi:MAG: hypothetical protein QM774_13705 [Gordonia sp. (in: high G+C Gram-positive bacteria)]|uniref:hypothetical protein n=1 Tax=Gordonia sp. (in: high G+C Gram-positive bacteria) TaxID=84139 RepID=UPI0039E3CA26